MIGETVLSTQLSSNTNTNRMDRVVVHGLTGLERRGAASLRPVVAPAVSVYAVTA